MVQKVTQFWICLLLAFTAIYFGGMTVAAKAYLAVGSAVFLSLLCLYSIFSQRQDAVLWTGGRGGRILFLWIGFLSLSLISSIYVMNSLRVWILFSTYYCFFLLVVNSFSKKNLKSFFLFLLLLGAFLSLLGFISWLLDDKMLFFVAKRAYHGRLTGTFVNPNHFAAFLGVLIPFIPYYWQYYRKNWQRLGIAVISLLITAAMVFTLSLGAWASLLICVLLYFLGYRFFIQEKKDKKPVLLLTLVLIIGGLAAYFFLRNFLLEGTAISKSYSFWQRINLYQGMSQLIASESFPFLKDLKFFLLGAGPGTFYYLIQPFYVQYDISQFFHAHNDYFELFLENGFLGTVSFSFGLVFYSERKS